MHILIILVRCVFHPFSLFMILMENRAGRNVSPYPSFHVTEPTNLVTFGFVWLLSPSREPLTQRPLSDGPLINLQIVSLQPNHNFVIVKKSYLEEPASSN